MMQEQLLPAFICQLMAEGVAPSVIERAVARTRSLRLGQSTYNNNQLWRAFADEQAQLLKRAL